MKDKSTNKTNKLVVRLTPNQSLMIDEIAEQFEVTKSSLVRYILDNFIAQYYKADASRLAD